jgi:hypothetical protein
MSEADGPHPSGHSRVASVLTSLVASSPARVQIVSRAVHFA